MTRAQVFRPGCTSLVDSPSSKRHIFAPTTHEQLTASTCWHHGVVCKANRQYGSRLVKGRIACRSSHLDPADILVVPNDLNTTAFVTNIENSETENTTEKGALTQYETIVSTARKHGESFVERTYQLIPCVRPAERTIASSQPLSSITRSRYDRADPRSTGATSSRNVALAIRANQHWKEAAGERLEGSNTFGSTGGDDQDFFESKTYGGGVAPRAFPRNSLWGSTPDWQGEMN
jgi:hypothetical protein